MNLVRLIEKLQYIHDKEGDMPVNFTDRFIYYPPDLEEKYVFTKRNEDNETILMISGDCPREKKEIETIAVASGRAFSDELIREMNKTGRHYWPFT